MSGKVLEKSTALDTMSEKVLKRTRKRPREAKPPQFETDAADEEERRALALVCEFASQQSRLMQVQKNLSQRLSSRTCCRHHNVSSVSSLLSFIQENASLRGRMSYLRQGLAVADDYLEHLVASKVSFSRQVNSDPSLSLPNHRLQVIIQNTFCGSNVLPSLERGYIHSNFS